MSSHPAVQFEPVSEAESGGERCAADGFRGGSTQELPHLRAP